VRRPGGAGRPERLIEKDSPFADLAYGLLDLRRTAKLSVRELASLTGYSASSISMATSGRSLPSLGLTRAFAARCGADPAVWEELRRKLASARQVTEVKPSMLSEQGMQAASSATAIDRPLEASMPSAANQPIPDPDSIPVVSPLYEYRGLTDEDDFGESEQLQPDLGPAKAPSQGLEGLVSTASGLQTRILPGRKLVFGRGPAVDLAIAAGRGLSRRAGVITMTDTGALVRNISYTHALYVEGDGYRIRLPRIETGGEPPGGWFLSMGTALVGSRAMLDDGQPLAVTVEGGSGTQSRSAGPVGPTDNDWSQFRRDGEGTLLPLYLDPMTKLFLVALIWCRPWLLDPSATSPLPRTPEIAHSVLEITGAYHELERFETDAEFRDLLSARVAEHIKVLRRKIADRGLAAPDVRLADEVTVRILVENGVVTSADLARLNDPAWRSRQEDLWWTES
jgi:transcriptional regulator with XRE-family HTH domain